MKTLATRPFRSATPGFFLRDDIDNFFDHFIWAQNAEGDEAKTVAPRTNIYECADNFTLMAELPGVNKSDICVEVENGVLTITAEKSTHNENALGKSRRREITRCRYQRSFNIDDLIDEKAVVAAYDNGVLTLSLPKKRETTAAKTEIAVS